MSSLFARIWLSYWLVMALTLAVALAVSFALAVKRADDIDRISPVALARSAQSDFSRGGRDGLGMWVMNERHTHPELQFYFVDDLGREFLGRSLGGRTLPGPGGALVPRLTAPGAPAFRMYVRRTREFSFGAWQLMFQPLLLLGLAVTVSGVGSAALAHQLTRPVVRLREGVRTVAAGVIETRMAEAITGRRDEIGGLARDIDQMTAHLRALIESKEELLRDISHELRSPLARLRIATSLLRDERPGENATAFARIDREVERLDSLIGQVLQFSRVQAGPPMTLEDLDLLALLEEAVEDARLEAAPDDKTVMIGKAAPLIVRGDRALLASAIENVLRNAVRFGPAGAAVEVSLEAVGSVARVRIRDAGPGIAPADLPRICEPFFRAQGSTGVGLGLSIAERVAALHRGRLAARNHPAGGFEVDLFLPTAQGAYAALAAFEFSGAEGPGA